MQFSTVFLSLAALAPLALAQVAFLSVPSGPIKAGEPVTITYSGDLAADTTIVLREGDRNALKTIKDITTTARGGSFTWVPDTNLPVSNLYALEIRQGTSNNYSGQFPILGGSGVAPVSAPAASASAAPTPASSAPAPTSAAAASGSVSASRSASVSASVSAALSSISASASASASLSASRSSASVSVASRASSASSSSATANASSTSSGTVPTATTNSGARMSSPLALVFCAVAAMLYLN